MANETDLDELSMLKHGYERFLSSPGDLDDLGDNAIITVRRHQQITTHFGPLTTKNKIKVSLSQEQILNPTRTVRPNITRSQSINIQKSLISPFLKGEFNLNRRVPLRPSLIPVKIKDQSKLRALTMGPNQVDTESPRYRSVRKFSIPTERRNYVSQQESTLSSLPIPMTQSLDPTINLDKIHTSSSALLDKFKCGICLNILNDSRVLDCLHTFCLECLYSIENTSQSKTSKIDIKNSICLKESKDYDKKVTKSSLTSNKPIKKVFSSTPKKRPDEPNKPLSIHSKRPLSSVTEKSRVSLKCPICGVRTEISIGGVSRVPKNYLLERQLQNAIDEKQMQSSGNQYCSQCYGEIEGIAYCVTCDSILCDLCQEAHLRQRWTAKHSVISLLDSKINTADRKKDGQNELVQNATLKCFIHSTQDLKLYCVKCDQVACHNCTILLHKGHPFETIEQAKQHIIKSFQMSVERNQKFHDHIYQSISKLAGNISKINADADAIQNEIECFLKDYFEALEAHKDTLLRQINKAKDVKSFVILEQQEYLKKRAQELKQANAFAENLLQNGNDIEMLTFIGMLQRRFEFCQKWKLSVDTNISNTFQFLREIRAPITPQQHNIPIYGVLAAKEIETE